MTIILDLFVLITTMSIFLMNMDFRYTMKQMVLTFIGFGLVSFTTYLLLLKTGYERVFLSSICFSLPSLMLCYLTSKYRDARFIFTFAIIDLIGMIVVILGRCISIPFEFDETVVFVGTTFLLISYLSSAYRFRKRYLEILRTVSHGWRYMAFAALMLYVFTFILIGYPTPIYMRREYVLTVLVYILVFFSVLKVIYEAAINNIKIYNDAMEKNYLKMELELNQVYYDMAYKDSLTGVKNRNAFEEYLLDLEHSCENYITCFSFDINNLKRVNDEIGHHAGDELIKQMGGLLEDVFSDAGSIFRIGGDEFIVICEIRNETWGDEKMSVLKEAAEAIREKIALPFEYAIGKCVGEAKYVRMLIKRADQAMYTDKNTVKNRDGNTMTP